MDPAYRFESAMRLQQRNQEVVKTDHFPTRTTLLA